MVNSKKGVKMKRFIILTCSILLFASIAWGSAYCEGWANGYKGGYCYRQFACMSPIPPMCPFPGFGENTYQDGYNRGFLAGLTDSGN